jgi:hypothetical protein
MGSIRAILRRIHEDESGHAVPAMLSLVAGAGGVAVGIGAASDSDVVAIVGGIALGVGVLGAGIAEHMVVDYEVYARLEKLEGKK